MAFEKQRALFVNQQQQHRDQLMISEQEKHCQRLLKQREYMEQTLKNRCDLEGKAIKQGAYTEQRLKNQLDRKEREEAKAIKQAALAVKEAELRKQEAERAAKRAEWEQRKGALLAAGKLKEKSSDDASTAASECQDDDWTAASCISSAPDDWRAPSRTIDNPNEYTLDEWKQLQNVQKQLRDIEKLKRMHSEGKKLDTLQVEKLKRVEKLNLQWKLENEPVMYKHRLGTYVKPSTVASESIRPATRPQAKLQGEIRPKLQLSQRKARDGKFYNHDEFLAHYGPRRGEQMWKEAGEPKTSDLMPWHRS